MKQMIEKRRSKTGKLALFAAGGPLPLLAIRQALKEGIPLVIIGFHNISDFNALSRFKNVPLYRTQIGYFRRILAILRKESVNSILMTGKIKKVNLFKVLKLDLVTLKLFLRLKDRSDASLLEGVRRYYEDHGFCFLSQKEFFSDCVTPKACLTRRRCRGKEEKNLLWAFGMARRLADLDIGQSLLAGNRAVIAVEAIEGTDQMICRSRGLLLKRACFVKRGRTRQNPKYDLPVFGLNTLKLLYRTGVNIIGLEAGAVLIPGMPEVIAFADRHRMIIHGL